MKKALMAFTVLVGAIIIAFLFAEISLRIFTHQNPPYAKYHEYFVYTLKPDGFYKEFFPDYNTTITMHANERGYNGPIYPYEAPDRRRIFVVGDSMVQCSGPGVVGCFPHQLNKLIGGNYDVVQMGVSSWALDNEFKVVEREGVKYNPDIVIVAFFINDFWDASRDTVYTLNGSQLIDNTPIKFSVKRKLAYQIPAHSYVARLLLDVLNKKIGLVKLGSMLGISDFKRGRYDEEFYWGVPSVIFYNSSDERIEQQYAKTRLLFRKYKKLSQEQHFKLYFLIIPMREQINPASKAQLLSDPRIREGFDVDYPLSRITSILQEENISYVYELERMQQVEKYEPSYFPTDIHLNLVGNMRIAQFLYERLQYDHALE